MSHFIKLCAYCGTVISQCRCMDKNKPLTYGCCDKCSKDFQGAQDKSKSPQKDEGQSLTAPNPERMNPSTAGNDKPND